jgi:hypothetical protein
MGIGIGIFLGLVFVGTIYLYTQTKDSWSWKTICKRVGIGFAIVIALPIMVALIYWAYSSFTDYLESKPKKISSLHGLTLGEKLSDVQFKLPMTANSKVDWDDQKIFDVDGQPNRWLGFSKKDSKLSLMVQDCRTVQNGPAFETINGINCNSTGEDILKTYGESSVMILCEKNPEKTTVDAKVIVRAYDSIKHGVRHLLFNNQVGILYVTKPEELKTWAGENFFPCDELENQSNKK